MPRTTIDFRKYPMHYLVLAFKRLICPEVVSKTKCLRMFDMDKELEFF